MRRLTTPPYPLARGPQDATAGDVDAAVRQLLATGESLYEFDPGLFQSLEPDFVLTQSLCNVCAVDASEIQQAATDASAQLWEWSPRALADILSGITELAELCSAKGQGIALTNKLQNDLNAIRRRCATDSPPRVAFLEWLDPLYSAGHWIPELVEIAGGHHVLGRAGERSRQIGFDDLATADPDVIIAACCGWPAERTQEALDQWASDPRWQFLRAVRTGRVHVVDAETQFTCPGTTVVDAAELLAQLIQADDGS